LPGVNEPMLGYAVYLEAFVICTIERQTLEQALALQGNDFEDNLQLACATLYTIDTIVTQDPRGFQVTTIPVLAPVQLPARLG